MNYQPKDKFVPEDWGKTHSDYAKTGGRRVMESPRSATHSARDQEKRMIERNRADLAYRRRLEGVE